MSDILFVNGAIQNRGFELDEMPGKISGIMLAQVLNSLHGSEHPVHLWNNVGVFHEDEELTPYDRLAEKYSSNIMQEHLELWGMAVDDIDILTDDDEAFAAWTTDQIGDLVEAGVLYFDDADFDMCGNCETVVAETVVGVGYCSHCESDSLVQITQPALFVNVPEERQQLLRPDLIYNRMNLRNERDSLKQIPPRLLLSRDRQIGIDLAPIGLAAKKLDPRMGIGMLAMYAADKYDCETVAMTQTTSTLIRTAPYIGSILLCTSEMRRLLYVPHTKIEAAVFDRANIYGRQVVAPFAAAQRSQDVDLHRFELASKEFAKFSRNAGALRTVLERLGVQVGVSSVGQTIEQRDSLTDFVATLGKQSGRILEMLKRKHSTQDADPEAIAQATYLVDLASRVQL